jgi:Zn-dependent M28 family amino/carboxypeptidase
MHKPAALLAAFALTVAGASSQSAVPDFSADRFKAHVAFLADDLLEGREAGTRGHEIAARYIAAQFALLGVKPGGLGGSYFETVDLSETMLTGANPTLTVNTAFGAQIFEHGGKVTIAGPVGGGDVKISAPLVFVGYGVQDAALGYDDYKDLDVRGKVAVALLGAPKGMDSEIGAHLLAEQLRTAGDHGAAAVIRVPTRLIAAAFPWEQLTRSGDEPITAWVQKDGSPFDRTHGLKASVVMETTAAAALFDGAPRPLAQILDEADKEGGRPRGFALKTTAELSATASVRRYSSPEVIGIIEGSDPTLKNEYVALMAHADHIGLRRDLTEGDRINNGALDNAAGIATLLEAARAFTSARDRPRRSILIVANTAEEKRLLGAEYFAHHPTVPIDRITAAIDLDMPLLTYDFTDVVAYGATHSTLETVFRSAGADMDVLLSPDPMPEQAVFVRSDHYAMVKAGVPAVMLATGMANGGREAWGAYLSTRYHRPSDDLSQPIHWRAGARFAELNYRVARALADADTRAQWYANDYFGNLFAPKAPKATKPATR